MLSFHRVSEVILYFILDFVPFLILSIYPFRKKLRYSIAKTNVLVVSASLLQIILGMVTVFCGLPNVVYTILSIAFFALFYIWAINAHWGKCVFTMLMLYNINLFIITAAKCLEGGLFKETAQLSYHITSSLCIFIFEVIVLIPLYFYIRATYSKIFDSDAAKGTWRFLWIVPITFYLVWFYQFYGIDRTNLEIALDPVSSVILLFINIGALLIYHMLIKHVQVVESNTELVMQNYRLATESRQYENLQDRIQEARKAKHDIRHHITLMDELLKTQQYDKLHEYLQSYKKSLPDDSSIKLCSHYATNTLLLYFSQQAKDNNIDFAVSVHVPETLKIPSDVLSVILGNLLENAIEACTTITDCKRFISVKGKYQNGSLFFLIENNYSGEILQNKKGLYLSSKHEGRGLGLPSVRDMVAKYDGMMDISHTEDTFSVSILMMEPNIE